MAKKPQTFTVTDGKLVLVLEVEKEGGYSVSAPFIQGLNTQAESIEEAFEMAYDAAELLAEVRAELTAESKPKRVRKTVIGSA